MTGQAPSTTEQALTPLQRDLIAMLWAMRAAERDLFAQLEPELREAPQGGGDPWSPKDVQAHLAAWRGIEARRLLASAGMPAEAATDDPAPEAPIDEANARLQARHAAVSWDQAAALADASVEDLLGAIRVSSTEALCECGDLAAGIGANGINHAIGHLGDIARLVGGEDRFGAFVDEVEAVLRRGHLPTRDSGVMLYNIACHSALSGQLDDARRLLQAAFSRRPDLLAYAPQDPDLIVLRDELESLAPTS